MSPTDAPRLSIDATGWCAQAQQLPSPNCDARPAGLPIDLLVIHNISLPAGVYGGPHIAALFANQIDTRADPSFGALASLRVSAHFLIRRDGQLQQFVATSARAWHAGVSQFAARARCNDFSIGIELEGCDKDPFTDVQYQQLTALTHALVAAHPLQAVTGHQHIAPGRKTDPGPCFDWSRYQNAYRRGLAGATATDRREHMLRFVTSAQPLGENAIKRIE
ncbi:MAG: 1,6-anhydro-N-acetylmuramyl-L-alanine amidase AmpD [Pseudomonadota bacterium]|nr:1,6-anhydro-N-acetylmuramyl-L-alanine amidase AmpD [Pseudomonadota bacterium]